MKAAFINRTGDFNVVEFGELPKPAKLGRGECLVKVGAVDVNPIDTYVRSGMIPAKLSFPFILGRDLAGTVEAVGNNVRHFKPGDRVWGSNQGTDGRQGTFAEYAVVHEKWLYPSPAEATDEQAVALSLVGITAYLGLVPHSRLGRGETLFVNGGSGGVGSCVVQIAKILGARVMTTAGSDEKAAACRELGADVAVNYRTTPDLDAAIREFAPEGVNVWWETRRQPDFERTVPLLSIRGRMVLMAGREARPAFPVGPFYVKDCSLHGFAVFNASAREQRHAANALNRWVSEGKLKARIDRVLPLSEAGTAHRLQEESTVDLKSTLSGKLVLKP